MSDIVVLLEHRVSAVEQAQRASSESMVSLREELARQAAVAEERARITGDSLTQLRQDVAGVRDAVREDVRVSAESARESTGAIASRLDRMEGAAQERERRRRWRDRVVILLAAIAGALFSIQECGTWFWHHLLGLAEP